jgi:hypothetical protein
MFFVIFRRFFIIFHPFFIIFRPFLSFFVHFHPFFVHFRPFFVHFHHFSSLFIVKLTQKVLFSALYSAGVLAVAGGGAESAPHIIAGVCGGFFLLKMPFFGIKMGFWGG